jgi:hypothetical protein
VSSIRLTEVRERAAAALAPASDDDPEVLIDVVDALSPPALLLFWADPWLSNRTVGGKAVNGTGYWDAWFEVLCVAGRIEPGPGMAKLEELVSFVIHRLQDDDYTWPHETFYAPRRFDIGGVTYLGARMIYRVPVTI